MMTQCFYHNFYILIICYLCIAWHIPSLISFSTIMNISLFVNSFNFTLLLFKLACHTNPGAYKKPAGSSSNISIHLFLKF